MLQGDPDGPSGLLGVLFTPLVRASVLDVAGSISGTVTYTSDTPADETEFASIQAELDESTSLILEEMQTTTVATSAAADGTYTLWFVSPGTCDVSASATINGTTFSDGPQVVPVATDDAWHCEDPLKIDLHMVPVRPASELSPAYLVDVPLVAAGSWQRIRACWGGAVER